MVDRPNGRARASLSAIASAALLAVMPSEAQAQSAPGEVYGGPGGEYFEYSCGPGRVLVGLRASAGVLLDSIQMICAAVDSRNTTVDGKPQGPVIGNDRPIDNSVDCPARFAVTTALMARNESHPHLGAIALVCRELAQRTDGGTRTIEVHGSGHLEGYESRYFLLNAHEGNLVGSSNCPGGYATGVRGRDDGYVTAFGLLCGPKPAPVDVDPNAGHTLGKRKKPAVSVVGPRTPGDGGATSSIPGVSQPYAGTLDQQRSIGSSVQGLAGVGAAPEQAPPPPSDPGAANTDQPFGASIFTDGSVPPPAAEAPPPPPREAPSPLINGSYSTTLEVIDSQCVTQDLRGRWSRLVELKPQPGILIPLPEYDSVFSGPVMLNVEGLRVSQSTSIPIDVGAFSGNVPATFDGAFTSDGDRFDVRFQAGNSLCRVRGTISGVRQST